MLTLRVGPFACRLVGTTAVLTWLLGGGCKDRVAARLSDEVIRLEEPTRSALTLCSLLTLVQPTREVVTVSTLPNSSLVAH